MGRFKMSRYEYGTNCIWQKILQSKQNSLQTYSEDNFLSLELARGVRSENLEIVNDSFYYPKQL